MCPASSVPTHIRHPTRPAERLACLVHMALVQYQPVGEWCASTKNSAGIRFSSLCSAANFRLPVALQVGRAEGGGVQGQDVVDITLCGILGLPIGGEFA